MYMPARLRAARRCGFHRHCLSLLVLAIALSGCATDAGNGAGGSDVYRSDENYVRLVPIEPGAPSNSHPFSVSADPLRRLLAGIEVRRAASFGKIPVFLQEELDKIAGPLATALSRAGPDQDVAFAVSGARGLLGRLSPESFTTGRVFVRGDSLNLIFGLMQARLDMADVDLTGKNPEVIPGERARRVGDTIWEIDPGRWEFHEQRGDWLVFDRSALPAAEATGAAPSAPDAEAKPGAEAPSRAEEIENRLRVLDALREKGAITEEEYRERRRAILEQI